MSYLSVKYHNMKDNILSVEQPIIQYLWKAYLICLIPTIVIVYTMDFFSSGSGQEMPGELSGALGFWFMFLIGPFIETIVMLPIIWVISFFTKDLTKVATTFCINLGHRSFAR